MNQIIHGDSYEILPTLPDKSFDTVIIDPPYQMGLDEWDKAIDIEFFTRHVKRVGKEFYAVFGIMPYLDDWHDEAKRQGFSFIEHISWVKRSCTLGGNFKNLRRTHEDIYIYAIGHNRNFYQNEGRYEDVKVPGILFDVITISSIYRYISALWQRIESGNPIIKRQTGRGHITHFKSREGYLKDSNRDNRMSNFTNVWSFMPEAKRTYNKGGKFHPTMKPVLLEQRLVEMLTPENGSVLDCFSGSGTAAIACQRLHRQFLCIEKEQDFYEYSLERLRGDVYQPDLNFTEN